MAATRTQAAKEAATPVATTAIVDFAATLDHDFLTAATTAAVATMGAQTAEKPSTATAAAIDVAVATVASHGLIILSSDEGNADHRAEDRDAKNQCSIHPSVLQLD